jgi:polyisoprenyl-teichoic acid--peptidoglycan teichoic acid transferase
MRFVPARRPVAALILLALIAWAALGVARDTQQQAKAAPLLQLGVAHPGESFPTTGTNPIIFLVLGDSTAREVEQSNLSDSIHLIGYNPELNRASILGFPRDLWVPIPGYGTDKINAATEYGGHKLMIQTIEDLTGLHIDYYASTGFGTFRNIISGLNGVVVKVPYPINDSHTGLNVDAGKEEMNGKEALDFARSRYGVPNGDFSRSENQGIILMGLLDKLRKQFKSNPSSVLDWIGVGVQNAENDIPFEELTTMGFAAASVPPKNVNNQIVPGYVDNVNGISIVRMSSSANKLFKDMAKDGVIGKK